MKTPLIDLKLGEEFGYKTEGDENIVVKVPRSVSEGFVYELGLLSDGVDKDDAKATAESTRNLMLSVIELVRWWNVDDENGVVLPLVSSIVDKNADKQREKRVEILSQVPVEVTKSIIDKVTASTRVSPRVEGF